MNYLNGITLDKEMILNYICDVWGESASDYDDWSSSELIDLIRDMNKYDEFLEFTG